MQWVALVYSKTMYKHHPDLCDQEPLAPRDNYLNEAKSIHGEGGQMQELDLLDVYLRILMIINPFTATTVYLGLIGDKHEDVKKIAITSMILCNDPRLNSSRWDPGTRGYGYRPVEP